MNHPYGSPWVQPRRPYGWAPPAGKPAQPWYPPGGMNQPGWPPPMWTAPAGKGPVHPYGPTGPGYGGEPVSLELITVVEPALNSVLPALMGLLQISEMLLNLSPLGPDMPGPEPTELTPGEPSPLSFGMGHLGLFGTAETEGETDTAGV